MIRVRLRSLPVLALGAALAPLGAQTATPDSTKAARPQAPAPAAQPAPITPLNFSGVIFGSYNYAVPTTPNQLPNQANNQFIIDRAYLNFRMPAGDRTSIRITTDVYQTSEATPNAYTVRAKYAYLDYAGNRAKDGSQLLGRIGILQNALIDYEEQFWPRYLSTVPTERAGYFASADVGVAGLYTLPNRLGEVYTTIVNGPGYASRERDRFKDFAARVSITPLAAHSTNPLVQSLSISAWGYKGALASNYVNGGVIPPVGAGLDRSRAGVLVGIRDPRLSLAAEYATRHDERDTASVTLPRTVVGTTGRLWSAYGTIRPLAFANATGRSPFGIVARYDHVTPTTSVDDGGLAITSPSPDNAYHNLIGGVFFDISQRAQIALDYQEALASNNGVSSAPSPGPQSKTYFAHFVVNF